MEKGIYMIQINAYMQYFTITSINHSKLIHTLYEFNNNLVTYKMALVRVKGQRQPKIVNTPDKRFYIAETKDSSHPARKDVIRYPITLLENLITFLNNKGISNESITITKHKPLIGDKITISPNPAYTPRPYQSEYIKRILTTEKHNLLIDLHTGGGKTYISMYSVSKMGEKFSLFVLPRYIDKWIDDVTGLTDIKRGEILVIKGISNLTSILNDPSIAKLYKCFIISLTTLNHFVKKYLTGELSNYTDKTPEDLFPSLGTSVVLNDESHQEFSNVYKTMLFSNVRLFIGITATLVSKDREMSRMHDIMFPEENRASNIVKYESYINVTSVSFRFKYRKQIRFKNNFGYNQPMLEGSIVKYRHTLSNYLTMITTLLSGFYLRKRKSGDKAIIFMGTVNMCTLMVEHLRKECRGLIVNKYTEEDDYSTIEKSDIIVSTPASASTALDIPNLVTTIQTVNVDSIQANLQTLGRLRDISGKRMDFVYIWSSDISSHKTYNHNRIQLFNSRAKSIRSIMYRDLV